MSPHKPPAHNVLALGSSMNTTQSRPIIQANKYEWVKIENQGSDKTTDGYILDIHSDGTICIGHLNGSRVEHGHAQFAGGVWHFVKDDLCPSHIQPHEEVIIRCGPTEKAK